MLITCDIDGVVGDIVTALLREVNGRFGTRFNSEICAKYKTVDNLPEQYQEYTNVAYHDPRLLQKVPLFPDALWGLQELVAMGISVTLMTGRGASEEWYGDRSIVARKFTFDWIVNNELPVNGVLFVDPSEKHCYAKLFGVAIEDDLAVVRRMAAPAFVDTVLLMDRPWNRSAGAIPGVERVKGWKGVVEALRRKGK